MKRDKWMKVISILFFLSFLWMAQGGSGLCFVYASDLAESDVSAETGAADSGENSLQKIIDFEESYKISNTTAYYENFYISDKMTQVSAEVDLAVLMSNTVIMDVSSITVYANEVPVGSYKFNELAENEIIQLHIDEQYFKKGNNTISVRAYIKSSGEDCEQNEEINWAIIKKGSQINIHYALQQIASVSELFEGTYFFENLGGKIILAHPKKMSEFDYTLVATISALIGSHFKADDAAIEIENVSYDQVASVGHAVMIPGTREQLVHSFPEAGLSATDEIQIRQVNGISHIFILLDNEQQLMDFTALFSNTELYEQLTGTECKIELDANRVEAPKFQQKINGVISEIGYEDSMIVGSGRQIFQYYIGLPGKYTKLKDNKLKFVYSYSENIDFSDSYVTIYVNGEPVKTKPLTEELATNDSIEFSIPDSLYDYNGFNIAVDFNLSKSNPCEAKISNGSWVKVDTQKSTYDFSIAKQRSFSLYTATNLVQDNAGCVDGEILVDRLDYSPELITDFGNYLGKKAFAVSILRIVKKDSVAAGYEGFILGDFKSSVLQDINDRLQIKFKKSGSIAENDLFTQVNDRLGVIQIAKDKKAAVIAGSDPGQLAFAVKHYIEAVDRYDDQIITTDDTILAKHQDEPRKEKQIEELVGEMTPLGFWKDNWEPILFAGVAGVVLIFFSLQINKKNNSQKAKKRFRLFSKKKKAKPEQSNTGLYENKWDGILYKEVAINERIAKAVCEKYNLNYETVPLSGMSREMLQYENIIRIKESLEQYDLLTNEVNGARSLEEYCNNMYDIDHAGASIRAYCERYELDADTLKVEDLSVESLLEIEEECNIKTK